VHGFRHERPAKETPVAESTAPVARQPLAATTVKERTPRAPQSPPQRSRLVAVG
jgi:hypothetical protein